MSGTLYATRIKPRPGFTLVMSGIRAILLFLSVTMSGCATATPETSGMDPSRAGQGAAAATPGTAAIVQLQLDQTVQHDDLQLRWLTLDDSRCPVGVACIWAGQILVTLEVVRARQGPLVLELLNRVKGEPPAVSAFDYELRLLGVEPHPKEGKRPARGDYVLRVEITSR